MCEQELQDESADNRSGWWISNCIATVAATANGLSAAYTGHAVSSHMPLLLLVEDNPADLRNAANIARRAGLSEIEVCRFATDAKLYLEKGLSGTVPLPDAIVIDLDLNGESGFETMRYWHATPELKAIPLIVWTALGDHYREVCRIFGVQLFISKDEGTSILLGALAALIPPPGAPASG